MATDTVRPTIDDPAPWASSRTANLSAMSKNGLADGYSASDAARGGRVRNFYGMTEKSSAQQVARIDNGYQLIDSAVANSMTLSEDQPINTIPQAQFIGDPVTTTPAVPPKVEQPATSAPTVPAQPNPVPTAPADPQAKEREAQAKKEAEARKRKQEAAKEAEAKQQRTATQPGVTTEQPGPLLPANGQPQNQATAEPELKEATYKGPTMFDIGNAPEGQAEDVPWVTQTELGTATSRIVPGTGGQTVDTTIVGRDGKEITLRRTANDLGGYNLWMNSGGTMSVAYSPGTNGAKAGEILQYTVVAGDDPSRPSIVSILRDGGLTTDSLDTRTGTIWRTTQLDNGEQEITQLEADDVQRSYRTYTDEMGNRGTNLVGERRADTTGWYAGTDGLTRTYNPDRSIDISGMDSTRTQQELHINPKGQVSGTLINDLKNRFTTINLTDDGSYEQTRDFSGRVLHTTSRNLKGEIVREFSYDDKGKRTEFLRNKDGSTTFFQPDGTKIQVKDYWHYTVWKVDGSHEDFDITPKIDTRSSGEKILDALDNYRSGAWEQAKGLGVGLFTMSGVGSYINTFGGWLGYEPNLPSLSKDLTGHDLLLPPTISAGLGLAIGIGSGVIDNVVSDFKLAMTAGRATAGWLTGQQSFGDATHDIWGGLQSSINARSKFLLMTDLEGSTRHPAQTAGQLTVGGLTWFIPVKGIGRGAGTAAKASAAAATKVMEAASRAIRQSRAGTEAVTEATRVALADARQTAAPGLPAGRNSTRFPVSAQPVPAVGEVGGVVSTAPVHAEQAGSRQTAQESARLHATRFESLAATSGFVSDGLATVKLIPEFAKIGSEVLRGVPDKLRDGVYKKVGSRSKQLDVLYQATIESVIKEAAKIEKGIRSVSGAAFAESMGRFDPGSPTVDGLATKYHANKRGGGVDARQVPLTYSDFAKMPREFPTTTEYQTWLANNYTKYFEKYYTSDGRRWRDNIPDHTGTVPPHLVRKSPSHPWIEADAGPKPLKPGYLPAKTSNSSGVDTGWGARKVLDYYAHTRQASIDAVMKAEKAKADAILRNELSPSVRNMKKEAEARDAYSAAQDKMTKYAERYGEKVGRFAALPEVFPDVELVELGGPKNGNGRFDEGGYGKDGEVYVVEDKSDIRTRLGYRTLADGTKVLEGTREYFFEILRLMKERGGRDLKFAERAEAAYAVGKLHYLEIRGRNDSGKYAGYQVKEFDLSKGGIP
ncbi:hypothetical protein [Nocardia sp. NPDC052566]|uniref:hypothetical protein n=1 Tax=Nocardia sp. NPDC052566 TaxID=3364330 RepID=UPI0037CB6ACF